MKDPNSQYQIDYVLLFILFAIGIVSCFAIASAQASLPPFLQNVNFVLKQIQWYFIGFIAIGMIMIIDFDRYQKLLGIYIALHWYYLLG